MKRCALLLVGSLVACGSEARTFPTEEPVLKDKSAAPSEKLPVPDPPPPPPLVPPKPPCPELHIVGIYESRSDRGGMPPGGSTHIRFARPGDNVLVLSSYEPTQWKVELAPGAALSRVILSGYHDQAVTLPAGIPVEIRTYEIRGTYLGAYGYAWPFSDGGSDTPMLVKEVEALTSRKLTSFHGCYRLTDVDVRPDLTSVGDCPINEGYRYDRYVAPDVCPLPPKEMVPG
jgi:hypothetical protein